MHVRGSHRFPEADFFDGKKHWNPEEDGNYAPEAWTLRLVDLAPQMGLKSETFQAKKGDILIWRADLAHGGSPISDLSRTPKSLVGHYCPASAKPHYFL